MSHALALVGGFLGGLPAFVGPLVIFLVYKDRSRYIAHHAREALNFQLSIMLYAIVSAILIIVLIGFVLLPLVGVMWLVLTIVATIGASRGEWYRYPFSIRFVGSSS